MSSKMLLTALAAVTAIAVVASPPQDPSFEFPAAKHVGFDLPSSEAQTTTQTGDRVSVTFRNATIREVLDWLKNQGVSFVVNDDQVDKDARVSINVINQPIGEVMTALARAWNGGWSKNKDIWVFQKGPFGALSTYGSAPTKMEVPGYNFTMPQGHAQLSKQQQEELHKSLQKSMEKMKDSKAWEQHSKDMEKWSREFEQKFKDGKFDYKIDPKMMEEFKRQGKSFQYEMKPGEKGFMFDGEKFKALTEKDMAAMRKHIDESMKKHGVEMKRFEMDHLKHMQELEKNGFRYYIHPEQEAQRARELRGKGVRVMPGKEGTVRLFSGEGKGSLSSHNLKEIYESLTPVQIEKLKSNGYINYSDLTSKQRALLGTIGEASWTISYKTDKVNLTIKSDR